MGASTPAELAGCGTRSLIARLCGVPAHRACWYGPRSPGFNDGTGPWRNLRTTAERASRSPFVKREFQLLNGTESGTGSLEFATLQWVSWFNHHRLLEPIGYIPPAEAEANYYRQVASQAAAVAV